MTFLEALFGSQYLEIQQSGKDGNKARLNGNLFLSAMLILAIFIVVVLLMKLSVAFASDANGFMHAMSGGLSGKSTGKLLAIPLLVFIYLALSRTVGSEVNFKKYVGGFLERPETEKQQANKKVLIPFFGLLVILIVLMVV